MTASLPAFPPLRALLCYGLLFTSLGLSAQFSVGLESTDPSCFGLSNGLITASPSGGTAPYTYLWSNGATTQTITNLNAGTYGVTVTDDQSRTATASVTLNQPDRVFATISTPTQCEGPFIIGVEATGGVPPYSYRWSTGQSSRTISVPVGSYCVTVIDDNLCGYIACTELDEDPPNLTATAVDALCSDSNDGSVTANPTDGTPPFSYRWSNGGTGRTITGLAPGAYRVTLTDARNCSATATATVGSPPELNVDIDGDPLACEELGEAVLRALPSGGTPPYRYNWSNNNTTQGIGGLGPGTYRVTVTDANNCTDTEAFTIGVAPDFNIGIQGDDILCTGETSTTLTVTVDEGTLSDYRYEWSTGSTSPTITNVGPGTYSVTATSAFFCEETATFTVSRTTLALTVSGTDTDCDDDTDGAAVARPTGGVQPYRFRWSTGATTPGITGLSAGTYRVTVTDDSDCSAVGSVVISAPSPIDVRGFVNNESCPENNDGRINVTVSGGTGNYSYRWSNGATTEDLDGLDAGSYTVTVTDANSCTETATFVVREPPALEITSAIIDDLDCRGDDSGRITITVSGGTAPYTYTWSNGVSGANVRTISGLDAGTYSVTVTDDRGCATTASYTVTEPAELIASATASDVLCPGESTGRVNLTVTGGTAPFTYLWSNGSRTEDLTNVGAGTYSVTVTDANGCTDGASATVSEPQDIVITPTVTDVDCAGDATGSISVTVSGGTPGYTYTWSNGDNDATAGGLTAGTYTVTVTDANGCTESLSATVGQPPVLGVNGSVTDVPCAGDATGAINITPTGGTPGYTYSWSTGATSQDIDGLTAGAYTVTVTDANACTVTETFTVGSASGISLTGTTQPADCAGQTSGSVNITVSGGTGSYTYEWSNGATTQDLTNVAAGTYTVTVSDQNECDAVASFTVTEPEGLSVTASTPLIVCGGTATGSIILTPSGGTPPYSFAYSNGDTGRVVTDLPAGSYVVTVTDANGCTDVTTGIVLDEVPQLTCEVIVDQQPTTGDNGALSVAVDGGTAPYRYNWSTGATTPTVSGLSAGTYSVTVTDANNCTTTCNATLRALSGIGDYVWEDINADGQQDPDEPGIEDFPVFLKDANGTIIDSTRTDENGFYSFMGLEPGTYSIFFDAPDGAITSPLNVGDDTTDSDADPEMNNMTGQYTLAPGEFNMTVDAGFYPEPGGEITDPCNCLDNNTDDFDGQFSERIEVTAGAGQNWRVLSRENIFLRNQADPPADPIPVPVGQPLDEVEPGVYAIDFRLVDSIPYEIVVTNGSFTLSFGKVCVYPTFRLNAEPPSEFCIFEEPFQLGGTATIPGEAQFTVNGVSTNVLDPSLYGVGDTVVIQGVFVPTDPEDCLINISRSTVLVDECNAKIGDFVFLDANQNGIQEVNETGIGGVKVTVTSQDGSYMDMTTTDDTGMYMFSVPPGTYKVTFEPNDDDLIPSPANQGANDAADSDASPTTGMTGFYTVGPDEMNFTIDAGFYNPCPANITDPGTIAASQVLCGPGVIPDELIEIAPATGGEGPIEYLWMFNEVNPNDRIEFWTPIPNTNSPNYQPGPISRTTYFVRCVRREGCVYLESNTLTIEVGSVAVADVSGPSVVCAEQEAIFQASNPGSGASFNWEFTGNFTVNGSTTGSQVRVTWNTRGNFTARLSVTRNGCTSVEDFPVSVIRTPSRCGGALAATGTVNSMSDREVTIGWEVPAAEDEEYDFAVERSINGRDWEMIGQSMRETFMSGDRAQYRFDDVSPVAGRTLYRVRLRDADYGDLVSNLVELQLAERYDALGRVFPNPTTDGMIHLELMDRVTEDRPVTTQIYDARGNATTVQQHGVLGTGIINLSTDNLPAGVYFLRLNVGDDVQTLRVIVR